MDGIAEPTEVGQEQLKAYLLARNHAFKDIMKDEASHVTFVPTL